VIELHVKLVGGGTANWSDPVRVDEKTWKANYETFLVHRYTFEDGRSVHVRTRYTGVDDISAEGEVYGGYGNIQGLDDDGDTLHGRVDWKVDGDYQAGIYSFSFGTGKWEGVSGSIEAPVWAEADDPRQEYPPKGPIRMWGFIEGEGELELPNLGSA
jgi:hypothetical protein